MFLLLFILSCWNLAKEIHVTKSKIKAIIFVVSFLIWLVYHMLGVIGILIWDLFYWDLKENNLRLLV
jgi:hypothetical protein